MPLQWALTQHNLGCALLKVGIADKKPAQLIAAVAAFHAALEVRTHDRVPLNCAATQQGLRVALLILGELSQEGSYS